MKKIFLCVLLLISTICISQTSIDLSGINGNTSLGSDCSSTQPPQKYVTTGDVNLNGYTLTLRNVELTITGNLNGSGRVNKCGNNLSRLCVIGLIQNTPNIENGLLTDCQTLSNPEFVKVYDEDIPCNVYDIMGKLIHKGTVKDNFVLPKNKILIIKTDKYTRKIILQ